MKDRILLTTWVGVASLLLGSACSGEGTVSESSEERSVGTSSQAFTKVVDLISPKTCTLKNGRLGSCVIKSQTISGTVTDSAVPLRTTISRTVKGNCSIRAYDLAIKLSSTSVPTVSAYRYMDLTPAGDQVVLRRRGGAAISSISLSDAGTQTAVALFPSDCTVSLKVVANEVDVDSSEQAEEIIAALTADLNKKLSLRATYEHLMSFSGAFGFLQEVAESFRVELTNELVQELRAHAEGSVQSISGLFATCNDMMSDEDRANMMLLILGLPALGSPEHWVNADGSAKTLEDFMGPNSAAIYATVDRLVKANALPDGQSYEALYKAAALDVERADAKLALARAQLADWL